MLSHDEQLAKAATLLSLARTALALKRPDKVRHNLERAIGFMSQVYGELQQEYLISRGAVLPKTSGSLTITEEPPERSG